jgi:hypothetical protein
VLVHTEEEKEAVTIISHCELSAMSRTLWKSAWRVIRSEFQKGEISTLARTKLIKTKQSNQTVSDLDVKGCSASHFCQSVSTLHYISAIGYSSNLCCFNFWIRFLKVASVREKCNSAREKRIVMCKLVLLW